jgi:nicotinamidase-related amidase
MDTEDKLDPRVVATLIPNDTAIIVVDMMDAYCNPKESLPKYLEKVYGASFVGLDEASDSIVSFLDASRQYRVATTVFVRMIERSETLPSNISLKMMIDNIPPVAEEGGEGWGYYKVKPKAGDYEITKYFYDAFMGTDLDKHLKDRGVKTVIIVGGHASYCIDTTARSAAQLGYNTFVPADLTADPVAQNDPESIRKRLDMINTVLGYMPLSSTILQIWEDFSSLEAKS